MEDTDHMQRLMDEAYAFWQQNKKMPRSEFLDRISAIQKIAVLLGNLNYQVCNGGFMQWIDNGYCLDIDELIDVVDTFESWAAANGHERARRYAAELLSEMLLKIQPFIDTEAKDKGWLGSYLVDDIRGRRRRWDEDDGDDLWDRVAALTEPMDSRFYEINKDLLSAWNDWLEYQSGQESPNAS